MTVRILAAIVALLWLNTPGYAADVRPFISGAGDFRAVVIEGIIEPGDYERFVEIVKQNQGKVSGVWLFSPGGDFSEAMKIGRAMRALDLSSRVPMRSPEGTPRCDDGLLGLQPKEPKNCNAASAAFIIHVGAVHRGGTYLAVHRPVFASSSFGRLSESDAQAAFEALLLKAREYMQEMGVPSHIQDEVLGTPSDKALILDDRTIKTHFRGKPAYRDEWVRNKCSRMTTVERSQSEAFNRRLLLPRNHPQADFSKLEMEELKRLRTKQDDELQCAVAIDRQSRLEAYEKFFGRRPTDFAGYNFAKWSQAVTYLGRQFYDIAAEERFEDDRLGDNNFLERAATSTAPNVSLGDFGSKKRRVVTWVNLVSAPNPSPEFIHRLVESLRQTWGNPAGGNGTTEWFWQKPEYSARLRHKPQSATGPFLSLVIEAK